MTAPHITPLRLPDFSRRIAAAESSAVREILKVTEKPEIISFAGGLPAPEFFPTAPMAEAFRHVIANDGARVISECHFLMIAQKIAPSPTGMKCANINPCRAQRFEKSVMRGRIAAETINDERNRHAAGGRHEQGIVDALPRRIIRIDIIKKFETDLCRIDQSDQGIQPLGSVD